MVNADRPTRRRMRLSRLACLLLAAVLAAIATPAVAS